MSPSMMLACPVRLSASADEAQAHTAKANWASVNLRSVKATAKNKRFYIVPDLKPDALRWPIDIQAVGENLLTANQAPREIEHPLFKPPRIYIRNDRRRMLAIQLAKSIQTIFD